MTQTIYNQEYKDNKFDYLRWFDFFNQCQKPGDRFKYNKNGISYGKRNLVALIYIIVS